MCGLLLDWYLGSQKLREILTLLYCITLSSSRENQRSAQEVERRISGTVAGEIYAKSRHTKYPSQPLSFALHYLPFASHFPLPHFTLAILFALFSIRFFPVCFDVLLGSFARLVGIVVYLLLNRESKIYGSSSAC